MVGRAQESIASLGAMCCALASGNAIAGVGTQTVGWALTLELAYSKGPFPRVRRAIIVLASTSALGYLLLKGKGRELPITAR
jgi:hypothetical protein